MPAEALRQLKPQRPAPFHPMTIRLRWPFTPGRLGTFSQARAGDGR